MNPCLRCYRLCLSIGLFGCFGIGYVSAQSLDTQPLTVTAVCPGSTIDVMGIRSDAAAEYRIELSPDGSTYIEIPSALLSASGRYEITYRATIPPSTPAGSNYRIRIVSKTPTLTGTPSPTKLTVRTSPTINPPSATINVCQAEPAVDLTKRITAPSGYSYQYFTQDLTTPPLIIQTDQPKTVEYQTRVISSEGCLNLQIPYGKVTVTVKARPAKPTVSASTISFCQLQSTGPLSATAANGASLVWYGSNATGGTGLASATQPSTTMPGTFKYYVAQKLADCESERAEITVEVKPTAPLPTVSAVSYCQGASASPLSAVAASNGTLNWYTSAMGGTGSPVVPTPATTNVGTVNYYVSQTVGGGCESARVALPVTVNGIPAAPTVGNASVALCQNTQSQPLTASGQNLKWYETATGGTSVNGVTPNMTTVGTKPYFVSQTVNGCEGPRTSLTVTIKAQPAAPTATNAYTYCQNTTSVTALTATGSGLKWYNSGGSLGNTAPTPKTNTPGTVSYFVTQSVEGCESTLTEIKVTTKPTPGAPGTSAMSVCQNSNASTLSATGQNLKWYASDTTKTGLSNAPTVATGQPGTLTYYVSQTIDGCEGPRTAITTTIKPLPTAPTVASAGPVYCQNATASALMAGGQALNWYRDATGGASLGNSFTPDTKTAGSFTYYVSQTVNGCEGPRNTLTVKINGLPAAPSATNTYSYCQRDPASPLTASGNGLNWSSQSGNIGNTAPTPSTDNPGTVSYFVTQSVDGCKSPSTEIKVTTKPTPGAPGTSALSVCQNEQARTLSAIGQNLLWYTAPSGGSGATDAPTLNTAQPGQTNFYVSQKIDGCEGPRAPLTATVKPLPAAPAVSPKNICQFAKAEPLSVAGEGLTWYLPDGSRSGLAPVINTDKGATFDVKVSQTVNGCEGPKATLTVSVLTTPAPTVGKSSVEFCQGAVSQPLEATGSNLKWIDPNGNVTNIAPAPPTLNATQKADGDVYYVTQTGSNGCESPRAAIQVFVRAKPTLALAGATTVNLGLEVPIKLTFTSVGPYQYKLSNGVVGTATKDTTIRVLPDQTTTYQVLEVSNRCGTGLPGNGASVTITVKIPRIITEGIPITNVCAGTRLSTLFKTIGEFNPGSVFKLQFAKVETDSTKIKYVDLPDSSVTNNQLFGTIPRNTPAGTYWVRVIATNPKIPILGSRSPTPLTVRAIATATLTGTQSVFEGQPVSLSVAFTGEGPWTFSYRDSSATDVKTTQVPQVNINPYILEVRPAKTTAYYLTALSNMCDNGNLSANRVLVTVNPLLGIEDQPLADAVDVYPVPATTTLTVRIRGLSASQTAHLALTDMSGRPVVRQETRHETSVLELGQYPAGSYLLRIEVGGRTASKRILKL